MKKQKFFLWAILCATISLATVACDDSNDSEPDNDPLETAHFDIWVSIGGNSGMGSDNTQLVKGVKTLEEQETIDFKGTGTDVTAKLYQESIIKGKFHGIICPTTPSGS